MDRMAVVLAPGVVEHIHRSFRGHPDAEGCGFLLGRPRFGQIFVEEAILAENLAPPEQRAERFLIDPRRLLEVEREVEGRGGQLLGFYHTHPRSAPYPSRIDLQFMALWPGTLWLIAGQHPVESPTLRVWSLDDATPPQLRELPILSGELPTSS
jgi:proteasome lid subunit RPN8/RPN11